MKETRAVHCGENVRGDSSLFLGAGSRSLEQRRYFARTRDPILIFAQQLSTSGVAMQA
jgi:hypothetical protein